MQPQNFNSHFDNFFVLIFCFSLLFFAASSQAQSNSSSSPVQLIAVDSANAREFPLQVNLRKLLIADNAALDQELQFYAGHVEGDGQSWVRLTKSGNHYSGMLVSGGEWFEISNSAEPLNLKNVTDLYQSLHHRNFRHSFIDKTLYAPGSSAESGAHRNDTRMGEDDGLPKAIKIGVVVDSLFNDYFGGNGLERALNIVNSVDGIYQSRFGISIVVGAVRVYDNSETDPLREAPENLELLISRYREIRLNDDTLGPELALVHLFSGHNADNQQAVGVGWINTLCRQDGFNTSLSTPFELDVLLAAHEMGHNFGAVHDSDPVCNGLVAEGVSHIMSDRLSSVSQNLFSQCSINAISPSRTASCQFDNIDMSIQLQSLSTELPLEKIVYVQINNMDGSREASDVFSRTIFPLNTLLTDQSAGCFVEFSTLVCNHGRIGAGLANIVSVRAKVATGGSIDVSSSIELSTFVDTNTLDNSDSLNLPLADAPGGSEDNTGDDAQAGGSAGGLVFYEAMLLLLVLFRRRSLRFS